MRVSPKARHRLIHVAGWRWLGLALVLTLSAAAYAQPPVRLTDEPPLQGAHPQFLVDIWLALPNIAKVGWSYAYLRLDSTNASVSAYKQALLDELDQLAWRLGQQHYPELESAVAQWRARLKAIDTYRLPGHWDPASLLADPHQVPPITRVVALGACDVPDWLEVWDSKGIERLAWSGGTRLSDVIERRPSLTPDRAREVVVVAPDGDIDFYGVDPWNYADTPLQPGSRVVGILPLKGQAFGWIRNAIAEVLAHAQPGDSCREARIGTLSTK